MAVVGSASLDELRFIADCMLGRLAKWLRVLGYDVAYERAISDDLLVARARAEGRILLTRDRRLVQRRALRGGPGHLLIKSDQPDEQLVEMAKQYGIEVRPDRFLTRCLRCNEPTDRVPREAVKGSVPSYVFLTQEMFSGCPACGRVYWRATHVESILRQIGRRLGS